MDRDEEPATGEPGSSITPDEALKRWRVLLKRLPRDEGGGWYAQFPAFGPAAAHGDAPTIAGAIADATISLNLVVDVRVAGGRPVPPDDVPLARLSMPRSSRPGCN